MRAFQELTIGSLVARNRIVRAACAESLCTREGAPTKRLAQLYMRLAEGGAGIIITGYASVLPDGKASDRSLDLSGEGNEASMRSLVEGVHAAGGRIVAQLVYGGSKSSLAAGDERRIPQAKPDGPTADILGPSQIAHPKTSIIPRAATREDLENVAHAFAASALRAQRWGFDGVEIHAAHGYLLSQFLDARLNRRTDGYGGDLASRARLACECVAAARAALPGDFPVLVKLNSCDDAEDAQGERGGLSQGDCAQAARLLVEAGASAIEVSGDWHAFDAADAAEGAFFEEFGARLARELDVPVIVTGGWRDLDKIERALGQERIAAVGMCRPLICEPDLPARWKWGQAQPSRCTSCDYCTRHPGIPCIVSHR